MSGIYHLQGSTMLPNLYRYLLATFTIVHCVLAADQDILTILGQQSGISTFLGFLEKSPDLVDVLNQGIFSVLVPTDQAFAAFAQANPNATSDDDAVRALIQYHIANGTHPSATFGFQPSFVPTLLTDQAYTNVTGGQVIEIVLMDSQPTIVSGVKATSRLVEADIFFIGGLVHVIDSVLTIPLSFPATISKARLTELVALLNQGGWLKPDSPAVDIVNSMHDLSIFAPNNSQLGPAFTGWDGLTESQLLSIFQYSITQGPVIYSSEFKNNTKIPTLDGNSILLSDVAGQFYVDTSLITTTDYLTSNGVLQVLDSPLNPNNTGLQPLSSPSSHSNSGSSGISPAVGAGIGIGICAVALGIILAVALRIRTKKRRRRTAIPLPRDEPLTVSSPHEAPPNYDFNNRATFEEGSAGEKNAVRAQTTTPVQSPARHIGFQARY